MTDMPPVCDYEGSDYRTRFWEGQQRGYEDQAERVALRRLLPPSGHTLIEIGAGFGRLADEYLGYETVVLFDYSRSLLREAQAALGDDPRFLYVAGNWYQMPFVSGLFDAMVQIRTLHHAADVPALFAQLARIARPGGQYVLEFANKQNLKAMVRYGLRRQSWSPFTPEPVEFVELNFDFHPRWIRQQLQQARFSPGRTLTVSYFRVGALKRLLPTGLLVGLDSVVQYSSWLGQFSPSVFVLNAHPVTGETAVSGHFFACPTCQTPLPDADNGRLTCPNPACGHQWRVENGLYDFKEPIL
ncbi:MAG: class I SAM-dependent methyltransferase [Ardenticatenaceae bacterium]|nr:class I SAM-dependent methyltransferase [Ardenticatenaceae bacterium]